MVKPEHSSTPTEGESGKWWIVMYQVLNRLLGLQPLWHEDSRRQREGIRNAALEPFDDRALPRTLRSRAEGNITAPKSGSVAFVAKSTSARHETDCNQGRRQGSFCGCGARHCCGGKRQICLATVQIRLVLNKRAHREG